LLQRNIESSIVTLDPDRAEKQGQRAEDLCTDEVGGEGAESMREATFRPPLAG
jgi:hypothetical protein